MIQTKVIRLSHKKLVELLFYQNGKVWMYVCLVGILFFIIAGFTLNLKFFILALMWIFLIIPLLISFLYFFYGLNPLTSYNVINHTIIFSNENIIIHFLLEEDENNKNIKDIVLPLKDITEIKRYPDSIILFFKDYKEGWLWLPFSGFNSFDDFNTLITHAKSY